MVSHALACFPHGVTVTRSRPRSPAGTLCVVCQSGTHRFMLCSSTVTSLKHYWPRSLGAPQHSPSPSPPGSFPTSSVLHADIFTFFLLAPSPRFWLQSASELVVLSHVLLLIVGFRTCHFSLAAISVYNQYLLISASLCSTEQKFNSGHSCPHSYLLPDSLYNLSGLFCLLLALILVIQSKCLLQIKNRWRKAKEAAKANQVIKWHLLKVRQHLSNS